MLNINASILGYANDIYLAESKIKRWKKTILPGHAAET